MEFHSSPAGSGRKEIPVDTVSIFRHIRAVAVGILLMGGMNHAGAATTIGPLVTDYDIYVVSGTQANANQGGTPYGDTSFYPKGAMMISAARDDTVYGIYYETRTMDTVFSFNTATDSISEKGLTNGIDIVSAFDAQYGAGMWAITSISISLSSNYATAGVQPNNPDFNTIAPGYFTFNVLGANPYIPTLTWNTLQTFLGATSYSTAGTFYWPATSDLQNQYVTYQLNVTGDLVNAIMAGKVTLLGLAADDGVGYLFNTNTKGTPPYLMITADAVATTATLRVTVSGSGSGSISSSPSGISCGSGACTADFERGATVTLTTAPDGLSTFAGWGGACAGTSPTCNVVMSAGMDVTAQFAAAPRAMIGDAPYGSLNDAYAAASDNAVIRALDAELGEILDLTRGINVLLMGGYNASYSSRTGLPTVLNGALTITSGSLTVDNLLIK